MNMVNYIVQNAIVKGPSEWNEDQTIYEAGTILVMRRYDNPQYSDPSYAYFDPTTDIEFRIADGEHRFVDLESIKTKVENEKVELVHGTALELQIKFNNHVPLLSQLICEIQEDGSKRFKLGSGLQRYEELPYIEDVSEIPFAFIVR